MIASEVSQKAFRLLRDYIETECGILLGEDKQHTLETRLKDLVRDECGGDFMDLYLKARDDDSPRLRDRITEALTASKTYWFRDLAPFEIMRRHILPSCADELGAGRRDMLRIWSTACSTGQEPYSLAMCWLDCVHERGDADSDRLEILATDVSPRALERARTGCYRGMAMTRGLTREQRKRYFRREGRYWALEPEARERVSFEAFNLRDDCERFGKFDVIFSRYVALYYTDEFKHGFYGRLRQALKPGGHLFLGSPETLGGHCEGFELQESEGPLYYRALG